jgi:hypothetical protein
MTLVSIYLSLSYNTNFYPSIHLTIYNYHTKLIDTTRVEVAIIKLQSTIEAMSVKLRIIISTFQVIEILPSVIQYKMPSLMTSFLAIFKFLNIDLTVLFPISCFVSYSFIDTLIWVTLTPIVMSIILLLSCIIEIYVKRNRLNLNEDANDSDGNMVINKYLYYFFMLSYLGNIYLSIYLSI